MVFRVWSNLQHILNYKLWTLGIISELNIQLSVWISTDLWLSLNFKIFQKKSWRVFNCLQLSLKVHGPYLYGFLFAQLQTFYSYLTLRNFSGFWVFKCLTKLLCIDCCFYLVKCICLRLNTILTLRSVTALPLKEISSRD